MNELTMLFPYKLEGVQWVFDDPSRDLQQEAFVRGADTLLDRMTETNPEAGKPLAVGLVFSPSIVPDLGKKNERHTEIIWQGPTKEAENWNSYEDTTWGIPLDLCPALLRYFPAAPKRLHVVTFQTEK